jgi:flagellar motility protein MotE (MotC chaperone)
MPRRVGFLTSSLVVAVLALGILAQDSRHAIAESGATSGKGPEAGKEEPQGQQQPFSASHAARAEKAIQDARRQQLAEKEAALAAKEQELKKLSAKLEGQVKAMEESRKRVDESMKARSAAQKKQQDEKVLKMVKLFKTMRGEQAGQLIDSLHEDLALALLNRLDTKTVAKLAPFINQPRVVKWISENLQGK